MGIESYKHHFAKATLAQWFREVCEENHKERALYNGVKLLPATWRINRGPPNYGIWTEYPICLTDQNHTKGDQAWDELNWDNSEELSGDRLVQVKESLLNVRPPSYEEVVAMGLLPIIIFDVAIQHKGSIAYGFEVVYKNGISKNKFEYLKRVGIETYTIDADWILSRVKRPKELVCQRII